MYNSLFLTKLSNAPGQMLTPRQPFVSKCPTVGTDNLPNARLMPWGMGSFGFDRAINLYNTVTNFA